MKLAPLKHKPWQRIIAAGMVLFLCLAIALQQLVQIKITPYSQAESLAKASASEYMMDNVTYLQLTELQRVRVWLTAAASGNAGDLESHYNKASVAIANDDHETALSEIEACLRLCGKAESIYPELLMQYGCLLALLEQYQEAVTVFEEILTLAPSNTEAMLLQAQLMIELGDAAGAAQQIEDLLLLTGGDAAQYAILAQLCYAAARYQDAITYGEQSIQQSGGTTTELEMLRCMGYASLLGLGDTAQAQQYLTLALALAPNDGDLYSYRGICYLSAGDMQAACQDFTSAIANGIETTAQYYNRGVCYISLGEIDRAIEDMNRAIALGDDPDLVEIAQVILQQLTQAQEA